jgi:hypothetical protein
VSPARATVFLIATAGLDGNGSASVPAADRRQLRTPAMVATASSDGTVPELATWALMSLGFGIAGSAVRTRPNRSPNLL